MLKALVVALLTAYFVQLLQVMSWVVLARASRLRLSVLSLGWPVVFEVERGGTRLGLGLLPIWSYGRRASTQSEVTSRVAQSIWANPEADELARTRGEERARRPVFVQDRGWELCSSFLLCGVGILLLKGDFGVAREQAAAHLVQVFSELWPPWSDGASAIERMFSFLADAHWTVGSGVMLVRIGAANGAITLAKLALLIVSNERIALLVALGAAAMTALWAIALLCALFSLAVA